VREICMGSTQLACIDPVLLHLVIYNALGCSEELGSVTLISFGSLKSLQDEISFIGIDLLPEITG